MKKFKELKLSKQVLEATTHMGFEETTPIQEKVIPLVMAGKDIIGQAQTGTGKTAAFGIPTVEQLMTSQNRSPQALVVAPTRELAVQVAAELNKLGHYKGIKALPIYGGQNITKQFKALKKHPHIIVGTPGRLIDHLNRRTIKLDQVKMVTLDEADEMLNMGFIEDIENILAKTPQKRHTLMFSATMPAPIKRLAEKFMQDPELVRTKSKEMTVPSTDQYYVETKERDKFMIFCRLVDQQSPEKAIVFGRTKRRVDELSEALSERGYAAEGIHGDMAQAKRDSVMKNFKNGSTELLVATDVASRGLDVSGVTHIYNFDIPQDADSYVHRIGRTGRAGESGTAVTLTTPREKAHLQLIEKSIKKQVQRKTPPTLADAMAGKQEAAVEKLTREAMNGSSGNDTSSKINENAYKLASELLEEHEAEALVAGALKMLMKESEHEADAKVELTYEAPIQRRHGKNSKNGSKNNGKNGIQNGKNGKQHQYSKYSKKR